MLYAFPSFNHLGALDICVVHWDLIPLERNPVNALIIVKLRQGSGKDRQGMAPKAKGLKA